MKTFTIKDYYEFVPGKKIRIDLDIKKQIASYYQIKEKDEGIYQILDVYTHNYNPFQTDTVNYVIKVLTLFSKNGTKKVNSIEMMDAFLNDDDDSIIQFVEISQEEIDLLQVIK